MPRDLLETVRAAIKALLLMGKLPFFSFSTCWRLRAEGVPWIARVGTKRGLLAMPAVLPILVVFLPFVDRRRCGWASFRPLTLPCFPWPATYFLKSVFVGFLHTAVCSLAQGTAKHQSPYGHLMCWMSMGGKTV